MLMPRERSVRQEPWRIDSHQHFWDPRRGDYPWMPDSGPLVEAFLPADLVATASTCAVDHTIVVQAAPTIDETEWLYAIADPARLGIPVAGVVGWIDMAGDASAQLQRLGNDLLVGVRPMIQDIDDLRWILRPSVRSSLAELEKAGLAFELLCRTPHLPHAIDALSGLDGLTVVIDHLAKPDYDTADSTWFECMKLLAARPNTFVKLSGMATEVTGTPRAERFQMHVDFALEHFTSDRCLAGTDWPVSTLAMSYTDSVALLDGLLSSLDDADFERVWRYNAISAYRLELR